MFKPPCGSPSDLRTDPNAQRRIQRNLEISERSRSQFPIQDRKHATSAPDISSAEFDHNDPAARLNTTDRHRPTNPQHTPKSRLKLTIANHPDHTISSKTREIGIFRGPAKEVAQPPNHPPSPLDSSSPPAPRGEMSRSDRGGSGAPDQMPGHVRSRSSRPPSAFGISPRRAGGEERWEFRQRLRMHSPPRT